MDEQQADESSSQRKLRETSLDGDLKFQLQVTLPLVPMAIGRGDEVTPTFWSSRHLQHHHHHHHYHHHHNVEEEDEPPPPPPPPSTTAGGPKLRGGFQQMVRMMDSLILHNLPSLGYTRITAAKTTTTTGAAETRETKREINKERLKTANLRPNTNIGKSDICPPKTANVKQRGRYNVGSPKRYPVNNKWIESLRSHKQESQQTAALPAIDRRASGCSIQSASIANGRKARSVERLSSVMSGNAAREVRDRKIRPTVNPASLRSSTTTTTTLTLTSVRPFGSTRRASLATSTIMNQPSVTAVESPPAATFDAIGYEPHLVNTILKDMLHKNVDVRWEHIAGLEEAKNILQEAMVLPIVMPDYFTGIRRPWRGVLMVGPPGNGKTMLAKAVATECGTTFFNVSPSTLTSKYRGDSEKLVRLLFEMARFHSPSTVFIDEVDSLCSLRGNDTEHEASRRFKSELLIQMDGLNANSSDNKIIMVLAATNHPWDIDEAFRRRFEKRIYIGMPDDSTRAKLVSLCLRGVAVDEKLDTNLVSDKLQGYTAADVANVCRDAAMMSMRRAICGRSAEEIRRIKREDVELPITMFDFDEAIARCKKSVPQSDVEKYKDWMDLYGST